ncbi:MAG: hypothetical protein OM95_02845 [Bdellovibrio sp. ArHS]|uniref:HvfC/BufC N-terminal domain-containing protein n=1 Tax=Bdellovibrio sp. ArHS TaxID=1569284 RepID=UPI000582C415|nr:DNA-binding domain-containing protein [Bdellovibrio sp. ArHS]KHD89535.1 MAG: hypothetical protein OM95_02845 [Bdellovibrio sp. ArHS]
MNLNEAQNLFKKGLMGENDQAFQKTLKAVGQMSLERAFKVYNHSYIRRLTESLKETYPSIFWVLGADSFQQVAADYINAQPSLSYDLAAHGAEFPAFLQTSSAGASIPFLHELARFEWIIKDIYHTPTPQPLAEEHIEELLQGEDFKVHFIEAMTVFASPYSIYEVWRQRNERSYHFEDIHWSQPEHLLLYKKQRKIYVQRIEAIEAQILLDLKEGKSITTALADFSHALNTEKISQLLEMITRAGIIEDVLVLET